MTLLKKLIRAFFGSGLLKRAVRKESRVFAERSVCATEEEMVDAYYSGTADDFDQHLTICRECRSLYGSLCEALSTASEASVPERGAGYGAEVWARVSAQLPAKSKNKWAGWRMVPAVVAGLVLVFLGGMWTERISRETPVIQVTFVHDPAVIEPITEVAEKTRLQAKPRQASLLSDDEQDAKLLTLNSRLEADAKRALPEVLGLIKGKCSDRTKEHALFVLAQSDSVEAREALMTIARKPDQPELQAKAVRMMGMMGDEGARTELAGLYRTASNVALKREILNGLMFSGSKTILLKVARTEPDPDLRNSAIANLSITGMPSQVMEFTLKSAQNAEKKQILSSVFQEGDSQVLLNVLKRQPDSGMRVATIRSLAVMGERGEVLMNVYKTDSDETVRLAVLDALVVQQNGDALSELARDELDSQRRREILTRLATIRAQETFK